ncbi:mucin-4 [Lepus europaeus]|uniref:mucin-4 n=1 Tax=Lepus europaeus TaxID=9983 RepID=UPI002B45AA8A|nr:mucin-4 [Lepus europaeus]
MAARLMQYNLDNSNVNVKFGTFNCDNRRNIIKHWNSYSGHLRSLHNNNFFNNFHSGNISSFSESTVSGYRDHQRISNQHPPRSTSSTTSTQETSTVSQNPQTQSTEATRGSPTSTHVEVITSATPSSPATSSTTSTQETSAVSQNPQTQGRETTRGSPTSTHGEVTTSAPLSSPGGHTLTETVSQVTSPPGETATSPSSFSQTSTTSEVFKTPTSSYSTVETTEETSTRKTGSPPPVTSVVSTTGTSSTTCTQETSAASQNPQTLSLETTRGSPTSTHPDQDTPENSRSGDNANFCTLSSGNHRRHVIPYNCESSSSHLSSLHNSNFFNNLHSGNISSFSESTDSDHLSSLHNSNFFNNLHSGNISSFSESTDSGYGDHQRISNQHPPRCDHIITSIFPGWKHSDRDRLSGDIPSSCGNNRRHIVTYNQTSSSSHLSSLHNSNFFNNLHSGNINCFSESTDSENFFNNLHSGNISSFSESTDSESGDHQRISNQHPPRCDHIITSIFPGWKHSDRDRLSGDIPSSCGNNRRHIVTYNQTSSSSHLSSLHNRNFFNNLHSGNINCFSESTDSESGGHQRISNQHPRGSDHISNSIFPRWTHSDTDSLSGDIPSRRHIVTYNQTSSSSHLSSLHNSNFFNNLHSGNINCFSESTDSESGGHQRISNQHPCGSDHISNSIFPRWTHSDTDSLSETTEETSSPTTGSPPPVNSGVSTTATSSTTSTQETSAVSQNPQTLSLEATRGSPTSTHVEVITSATPSSPGETATTSDSTFSKTSPTSAVVTTTPNSAHSVVETTEDTSSPTTRRPPPVTSVVSTTATSSTTSTQETSTVSQNPQTLKRTEETSTLKTGSPPPVTSVVSTTTTSSTTSTQETSTVSQNPQTLSLEATRGSPTSTHPVQDIPNKCSSHNNTKLRTLSCGNNRRHIVTYNQTSSSSHLSSLHNSNFFNNLHSGNINCFSESTDSENFFNNLHSGNISSFSESTDSESGDHQRISNQHPPRCDHIITSIFPGWKHSDRDRLSGDIPSSFSQTPSTTSEVLKTPTSSYSTVETTEDTSSPTTRRPPPVTSVVSTTPDTINNIRSAHNTSLYIFNCRNNRRNIIPYNWESSSKTSTRKTGSPPPVTSVVSTTGTSSTTSTQETSAASQNPQTLSLETTRGSPTSTHPDQDIPNKCSSHNNTKLRTLSCGNNRRHIVTYNQTSSSSHLSSLHNSNFFNNLHSGNINCFSESTDSESGGHQRISNQHSCGSDHISNSIFPSQQDTPENSRSGDNANFCTLNSGNRRRHVIPYNCESSSSHLSSLHNSNFFNNLHSGNISSFSESTDSEYGDHQRISNQHPWGSDHISNSILPCCNKRKICINFFKDLHSGCNRDPSLGYITSSTSPRESLSVPNIGHTHATQTTPESQTMSSITPVTDTLNVATSAASSATPSGPSSSASTPQEASTMAEVTTSIPAPSGDRHPATGPWAAPTSPGSTLRPSGGPSPSTASTVSRDTAVTSTSGGPGGQQALPFASTSPATAQVISQTHQTRGTETTGEAQPSTPASSVPDTTATATAATPSPTASSTTSGRAFPETATAAKTADFPTTPSSSSHTTPPTAELLSSGTSHDATPGAVGMTSPDVPSTFSPTITGVPTDWTASSRTPQEKPAVSQMAHTRSAGTTRGPEVGTLASQLTDTFSTVTAPAPPAPTPTEHTSQTETRTPSPSGSSTASISTPGSHSHGSQTTMPAFSPPTLVPGHTAPLSVTSTSSPPTASLGSTVKTKTSGMITTSLWTNGGRSTALSPPSTTSLTPTNSTPTTSTGFRSTAPSVPVQQGQGVSLFPYGSSVGDTQFVRRTVDFTSQLFKPGIGFPLGSFLRDSLYFTDNGQIIFPESDSQIFSYPNPPRRGFTAWDPVAVVAPFWDDADFSIRRGTIFYQEYETFYNEYNPLVWQVESWIRRFTNSWSYKAKWTLKVTWANAPAYPAQWTFGTCTYQAILSTDGSMSYALFLYQSNGMQWDVAQRPGNSVLMGFSSADGYFANSPLISRPVWERYRPDRWLNSRLGLRGLQIYRLHREAIPNYRLKCQQWLQSQPQWPSWNWNQISCPCTWQQGRWDLRFRPVGSGWWGHGGGRKLCRFSSWQGGVCCSYGPWGELREGWRVHSPWHFEQELEAQSWCCHWNDKPFFCSLYQRRQPPISCAGYRPSRPGWMFGDPHITTLDGANYTFNGLGDFLLVRAWDGNSSFLLQGRTAQTGSAQATNFIAFAAQYESSSLAPITVQWFLEPNDTIRVLHNNQTVTFETDLEDAEGQEIFNTTGVLLTRNGSQVSASFDGTVAISVMAVSHLLHASSSLPEEYQGRTEGLLGLWNNNPDDDFRMPNGTSVARGSSEEQLFHYGMTWKLNGTGLLGQRDDRLPPTFTPVFFSQLLDNSSWDPALVSGCSGDRQCIYDALAMRDAGAGIHTRTLFRKYRQMNATQNQFPPSIKGEHVIGAYKGKTVWIPYTSDSENVVFTLRNNCPDIKLFENGTLLWTPKSLEPFTLEILVRSTKTGLSSAFQPQTVLCACSAESQCLYNQTSWVGNSSLQVTDCKCDGDTFGRFCERSKDPCEEECFPGVSCVPERGCEACPMDMTGDGRHCAALENSDLCQNHSCPVNYCHNQGHCYIAPTLSCQPSCTCPPAFTDARCFLAGNSFTPTTHQDFPLRTIQLLLIEDENASVAEVNASVAYRLGTLDVRAFLWNSLVEPIASPVPGSGSPIQRWKVTSHFQYRPQGPVIDFLNNRLQEAVVQAFFLQAQRRRWKRSEGPRNNVLFYPISRADVHDLAALNVSTLETYLKCSGYEGYHLVYGPQSGFTCTSPCAEGYCDHGGQCQHLPDGPRCSCVPFSIYSPWGERCEHLSVKVGAFLGILFGALGALLLLAIATFVLLRFCACGRVKSCSYPLGLVG